LIIHAYSEADFRKNNFCANFLSVSVFQCEASRRSPLASGRVRLRRLDGKITRLDAGDSAECLCGIPRPDGSMMCPDGYPIGLSIVLSAVAAVSPCLFLKFYLSFCLFGAFFSWVLT
jgi:hypothetical protein